MPEGKTAATLLAAFSICAGNAFVNLFNQVARRADLGDFGSQPRVKVGFLSNFTQYFARKIDMYPFYWTKPVKGVLYEIRLCF